MTWTIPPSPGGTGTWTSVPLTQDGVDPTLYKGILELPNGGTDPSVVNFMVQAASGIGRVALDNNRGGFYRPGSIPGGTLPTGATAPAATTLGIDPAPPASITSGQGFAISATLTSGGSPVSGKLVRLAIGSFGVFAVTGSDGKAGATINASLVPAAYPVTASFAGDAGFAGSSDAKSTTVLKANTSLSSFTAQLVVVTPGGNSGLTTTLTEIVGSSNVPMTQQPLTFTLTGPSTKTYAVNTNALGQATVPTTGLVAGTYTVTASYAGDTSHTGTTRTGTLVISVFTGFFAPVDNAPTLNVVQAGSAVPIKFSLGADRGLAILAAGSPVVSTIDCSASAPVDDIETTVAASSSGLQYGSNQYSYVWKTTKGWTGCRQVDIKLVDGTSHVALFKFK